MCWQLYYCYIDGKFVGRIEALSKEEAQKKANAKFNAKVEIL